MKQCDPDLVFYTDFGVYVNIQIREHQQRVTTKREKVQRIKVTRHIYEDIRRTPMEIG